MRLLLAAAATALTLSGCATVGSKETTWLDTDGNALAATDSRRSVKGFGGWLITTPDPDWKAKWSENRKRHPEFTPATIVRDGQPVYTMILLSNAGVGQDGKADVTCDIRVRRPDDRTDFEEIGNACFRTAQTGEPGDIFLTASVVEFIAEPTDPRGTWTVEVSLNDRVRNVVVPLRRTFTLE